MNVSKIDSRMKSLGITKAQLIRKSGLTRVTIDKVLAGGKINVDTLEALARGLNVHVGYFFDDDNVFNAIQTEGVGNNEIGRDLNGGNNEECNDLIRLREEVKYLKSTILDKNERISELTTSLNRERLMNDF